MYWRLSAPALIEGTVVTYREYSRNYDRNSARSKAAKTGHQKDLGKRQRRDRRTQGQRIDLMMRRNPAIPGYRTGASGMACSGVLAVELPSPLLSGSAA